MTHTVSVKDFEGFIIRNTMASSFGRGTGDKQLITYCEIPCGGVGYKVKRGGEVVYDGLDLDEAIGVYNNITE